MENIFFASKAALLKRGRKYTKAMLVLSPRYWQFASTVTPISLWTDCLVTVFDFYGDSLLLTFFKTFPHAILPPQAAEFDEVDAPIAQSKSTIYKDDIDFNNFVQSKSTFHCKDDIGSNGFENSHVLFMRTPAYEYIGLISKLTSTDKLYQPFSSTFMSRFSAPGSRGIQEMAAVQLSASTDMATSRPFWISTERSGMINILFDIHTELFQHWHLQSTAVDVYFPLQR